jgi:hypothetical protein
MPLASVASCPTLEKPAAGTYCDQRHWVNWSDDLKIRLTDIEKCVKQKIIHYMGYLGNLEGVIGRSDNTSKI